MSGCVIRVRPARVPRALGGTAAHEARQLSRAGEYPAVELRRRLGKSPRVDQAPQRRGGKRPLAQVEGEAHQRVEAGILERNLDEPADGVLIARKVGAQQGLALLRRKRCLEAFALAHDVPIAHRRETGGTDIRNGREPLEGADQGEARLSRRPRTGRGAHPRPLSLLKVRLPNQKVTMAAHTAQSSSPHIDMMTDAVPSPFDCSRTNCATLTAA